MSTLEFIAEFTALHDKAKQGTLTPTERTRYVDARAQFARLVVVAQQLGQAGQTLRSTLRMAKMLKVELRPEKGEPQRVSTIDVSSGGFAVLLSAGFPIGMKSAFTLYLPGSKMGTSNPINGKCAVASSRLQGTLFRVSFKFDGLFAEAQDQLDITLIDAVLERFRKGI